MHFVTSFLVSLISSYGYFAVFILMTLESALIPIPSEVTMPFAGFLAGVGVVNFWVVILVGALGNLVGSVVSYYLGFYLREENIRGFIRKWGKYLLIHEKDFDKGVLWLDKYGQGVAFFSRLLPVVRTFISLPAGIAEVDIKKFSLFTFLGSLIWSGVLAYFGLKLGQNWQIIDPYFRKFQYLIVAGLVLGIIYYIYLHFKNKKL